MRWLNRYIRGEEKQPQQGNPSSLADRARTAEGAHRYEEAEALYRAAIDADASNAELHYGLGAVLGRLRRPAEAVESYRNARDLAPNDSRIRNDLAIALFALQRFEEARSELEAARALAPDLGTAQNNLGLLHQQLGELDEAIACFRRAHEIDPRHSDIHSNLLLVLNYSARLSPAQIYLEHRRFAALHAVPAAPRAPEGQWPRKLRIGYVSPDFRSHVVSCFMLPILEGHDRSAFEVHCYYTYPVGDATTEKIRLLADHWLDCASMDAAGLAARIAADRIDILVDLAGHTAHQRLEVFVARPAPVQVTYLGYPNTTGLRAIDYRLSDAIADPKGESDALHAERVVRLEPTFLCFRPLAELPVLQAPGGSSGSVTFGSFNNFQKLSDDFFRAAARLLRCVPGSRLLLKAQVLSASAAVEKVHARFEREGIDRSRLLLRGWEATPSDHLALYRMVDIALDSFPYNGTTTTCEALWMGVPVVTLRGDRHAARVGASLLSAVGLDELVAEDEDAYVRIAAELAGDAGRLAALRAGMRERLRRSPLMDERGFVRELEASYKRMWEEKRSRSISAVPPSLLQRARASRQNGETSEARALCRQALEHDPCDAQALMLLWDLCFEEGEHADAVEGLCLAVAMAPDDVASQYMLGCTLEAIGRREEAIERYRIVLALDPRHAKAANNLGCVLETLGQLDEAAARYDKALAADPSLANARYNRGNIRRLRGELAGAEDDFRAALAIEPERADWHCALAEVLLQRWKLDEAEARQRRALALEPHLARGHFGLGNVLMALGRVEEAERSFRDALDEQIDFAEAHSNLLLCLHYGKGDNAALLLEEHKAWGRRHGEGFEESSAYLDYDRSPGRQLRIGYVSPNFHRHSVATFIEPLLQAHDRKRFSIHCFSNVAHPDGVTARLKERSDVWHDIRGLRGDAAARLIREQRIDILVDLAGHTGGGRPLLFARKPAPVQVTWLGYPNTTGLRAMDYRLTDAEADPAPQADVCHTERLIRLTDGFLCFSPEAEAPAVGELPVSRAGRLTFGSFNNLAKVSPQTMALWARILAAVPESRLLLKSHALGAESARRRIVECFQSLSVSPNRIVLLGADEEPSAHLGRYNEVDIALDTYPYHGTTTTCEALWMGVPVVTLAGPTHVSRVGASLLARVGLCDLVAHSPEAYVDAAVALASDRGRLAGLRAGLRERLRHSPLLDAAAFARSVERAYGTMWAAWCESAATRAQPGESLRLHIGGRERRPGWKILDAEARPEVDYVGDCTDLSRFGDDSVDEMYASHVLEHLGYQRDLPHTLSEMHRILKPGGRLMISVPDFEVVCRRFIDPKTDEQGRFHLMRIAFGGQVNEHDFHRVGLTFEFLRLFLYRAGFARVERVKQFGLFHDTSSLALEGELISVNLVAYK